MADRQTKGRQSNIELLRIIAMVFIVAHHFSLHVGFTFQSDELTVNRLWIQLIQIGGKIGVNVFVLVSGYFLIKSKAIKTSKILKLWLQIFTYSILLYFIFVHSGTVAFSKKDLIEHILPITFSQWWFASAYFVLYLIFPYLNKLLMSLEKMQFQKLLVLLFFIWCIIPTFTEQSFESNYLLWFVFLYALAGYIRLYGLKKDLSAKIYLGLAVLVIFLTWSSAVIFDIIGLKIPAFSDHATFFYEMQSLPILVISLLLLLGFSKAKVRYNRVINGIASATFGVYLIHDNGYVRWYLWHTLFRNADYTDSRYLIPYSLLVIAIVFTVCTLIELIRINLIEKRYIRLLDGLSRRIDRQIERRWSHGAESKDGIH
jgi:surface polysaccharide O-acyltransferase-like enzyme